VPKPWVQVPDAFPLHGRGSGASTQATVCAMRLAWPPVASNYRKPAPNGVSGPWEGPPNGVAPWASTPVTHDATVPKADEASPSKITVDRAAAKEVCVGTPGSD